MRSRQGPRRRAQADRLSVSGRAILLLLWWPYLRKSACHFVAAFRLPKTRRARQPATQAEENSAKASWRVRVSVGVGTRRVPLVPEHTPCNLLNSAGDCQVPGAILDALALRRLVRRRASTNHLGVSVLTKKKKASKKRMPQEWRARLEGKGKVMSERPSHRKGKCLACPPINV